MKARKNFLIGTISGIILSVILYLSFSKAVVKHASFIIGFIACLVFISLLYFFLNYSKQSSFFNRLFNNNISDNESNKKSKSFRFLSFASFILILITGLTGAFLILEQSKIKSNQLEYQQKQSEQQEELIKSIKQGNLVSLMSSILDKVQDKLKEHPEGPISDQTIAQIAALSYSFKPYRYLEDGRLSKKMLSPERGQLLLALSKLAIDSISFEKIIFKTSFSGVDLKGVDLKGINLSGANLRGANLREADLRGTNLEATDLREVDLWGANLSNTNLKKARLNRANLGWTNLENSVLKNASLNGINLMSAKLNGSDLSNAEIKWADLSGAFFKNTNLSGVNLYGTILERANLSKANLSGAKLLYANLSDTVLEDVDMRKVNLIIAGVKEENWIEKLFEWRVIGAEDIQKNYKLVIEKSKRTKYKLEKIKN